MTCQKCKGECEELESGTWWCSTCRKLYRRVRLRADLKDGEGYVG